MSRKGGFGKFITGALVGAGVALLFAPQEGSKTRRQLKKKIDELMQNIKEIDIAEVKMNIETKISEIAADLKELDGEKVLTFAKDKAKMIGTKCDELVKLAVSKGTPVVKKIAEDVRTKTIVVLEETINKLEKSDRKEPAVKSQTPNKKAKGKKNNKKPLNNQSVKNINAK